MWCEEKLRLDGSHGGSSWLTETMVADWKHLIPSLIPSYSANQRFRHTGTVSVARPAVIQKTVVTLNVTNGHIMIGFSYKLFHYFLVINLICILILVLV